MTCPHFSYETDRDGHNVEHPRPYCELAERFVQPLRADICNDRYDLEHEAHCEIYRAEHEEE